MGLLSTSRNVLNALGCATRGDDVRFTRSLYSSVQDYTIAFHLNSFSWLKPFSLFFHNIYARIGVTLFLRYSWIIANFVHSVYALPNSRMPCLSQLATLSSCIKWSFYSNNLQRLPLTLICWFKPKARKSYIKYVPWIYSCLLISTH